MSAGLLVLHRMGPRLGFLVHFEAADEAPTDPDPQPDSPDPRLGLASLDESSGKALPAFPTPVTAGRWRLLVSAEPREDHGATLCLLVLDSVSMEPAPGVPVRVLPADGETAEARTDGRGEARLPVEPGPSRIEITGDPRVVLELRF